MRKFLVHIIIISTVLSGCSKPKLPPTIDSVVVNTQSDTVSFEYSKAVGEAAINYYLDKPYDAGYTAVFSQLSKYKSSFTVDLNRIIQLDDRAYTGIMSEYNAIIEIASKLSDNSEMYVKEYEVKPWDTMTNTEMALAYLEQEFDLPEDILQELVTYGLLLPEDIRSQKAQTENNSELSLLSDLYFPDGNLPNIELFLGVNKPTEEFRKWFILESKKLGLLDNRLNISDYGTVGVTVGDLVDGGITFKVFNETYTVDEAVELPPTLSSPVYNVVLDSYKCYTDTGLYVAKYLTDTTQTGETPISIQVSFNYQNTADMELYLNSITNLIVTSE